MFRSVFDSAWFVPIFLVLLVVPLLLGMEIARRHHQDYRGRPVESALVGLLSLLLGFTFSQAGSSYRERLHLIHREADAIAECYRFAALMPPAERIELRSRLQDYLDAKVEQAKHSVDAAAASAADPKVLETHQALFAAAANSKADLDIRLAMMERCNDLIRLHFQGLYSRRERVPEMVLGLLIGVSMAVAWMVGFAVGVSPKRTWVVPITYVLLVVMTVATIRDLDEAYGGFIQVDFSNLMELRDIHQNLPK